MVNILKKIASLHYSHEISQMDPEDAMKTAIKICIGTFVLAVALFANAFFIYSNQIETRENGVETTAIITRAPSGRHGSDIIRVQYIIDGVTYQNRLRLSRFGTYVGDNVQIYYNANNHNQITPVDRTRATDERNRVFSLPLFFLGFSGLMFILSLVNYLHKRFQKKSAQKKTHKTL